jgi:hypothetical protein
LHIQQVSTIHDFGYVLKINMGIKQDRTPSKPNQIGISPPKDTIHGNISWLNTSIDENVTIDLIMNVMTSTETIIHIFQQGPGEGTLSFETHD